LFGRAKTVSTAGTSPSTYTIGGVCHETDWISGFAHPHSEASRFDVGPRHKEDTADIAPSSHSGALVPGPHRAVGADPGTHQAYPGRRQGLTHLVMSRQRQCSRMW
jgi:hypothetical protein